MSEAESAQVLLKRWRAGDEAAAGELYRRYSERLCALAQAQISERMARRFDADDILQSVFRTFFRRSRDGQFVGDHSSSLWRLLVRITLHKIQHQVELDTADKRDIRAEAYASGMELAPDAVAHDPTPAEAAALNDELEAALAGLDLRDREMVLLAVQGFSTPEIAAQYSCSRWAVRRVLNYVGHRLEKRLRGTAEA